MVLPYQASCNKSAGLSGIQIWELLQSQGTMWKPESAYLIYIFLFGKKKKVYQT